MAWTPGIPLAQDFISASQPLILGNFQALDVWSQVDHSVIDGLNNGQHTKVTFIPQAPAPAFPAGQAGFYSFFNLRTNRNEIYTNFANAAQRPLTPATTIPNAVNATANDSIQYTPGGSLVKLNWITAPNLGANRYNFSTNPNQPVFAGPPMVFIQSFASMLGPTTINLTAVDALGFNYTCTAIVIAAPDLMFMAIGPS